MDEGHKGSATRSDAETERAWRAVREALADNGGLTFEYSATFAQVTEGDDALFAEYARSILFDYAYRHFHADGFGKDYWVANLHDQDDRLYGDTLLMGGLLSFYEQRRYFDDAHAGLLPYRLARPLMVFVGDKVTAGSAPEVLQIIRFLNRMTRDRAWAEGLIAKVLSGESGLAGQDGADVFARSFPYLRSLHLPPFVLYGDLCERLFHGAGRLSLHLLRRADGEIGMRTAESALDAYFGVINVGDAPAFAKRVGEETEIPTDEDDAFSESLFKRIDRPESAISFLVGSKKFIEGWSSWRVSTMGLLKVGRSAGAQVLQLFGRGVRLQGRGLSMRRSESLPGSHPEHIRLVETLSIFGLRANYLQTFLDTLRREDAEPPVAMTLPIEVRPNLRRNGLRYPAVSPEFRFTDQTLRFDPKAVRVSLSLAPRMGVGGAQGYELGTTPARSQPLPEHTLALLPFEALYQHAVEHKHLKGWSHMYIPRPAIRAFFETAARLAAPPEVLAPASPCHYAVLKTVARTMVEKAIDQFYFRRRSEVETSYTQLSLFDDTSPNFPRVEEAPAYQLMVPRSLVEQVQAIIRDEEKLLTQDTGQPLPRLYVEMHLYAPVLLAETLRADGAAGEAAQVQAVPTGLKESEAQFVRDLRQFWDAAREQALWNDCSVFLMRNLPKHGIGFFQTAGFYPDFLLWLKRGEQQVLAFIEPHGATRMESEKIELLKLIRTDLAGRIHQPLAGWVVAPTPLDQIKWVSGDPNEKRRKLKGQYVLLQEESDYIPVLMEDLRSLGPVAK